MNMKCAHSSTKLFRLIESFTCNSLVSTGRHPLIPYLVSLRRVFKVRALHKQVETTLQSWTLQSTA